MRCLNAILNLCLVLSLVLLAAAAGSTVPARGSSFDGATPFAVVVDTPPNTGEPGHGAADDPAEYQDEGHAEDEDDHGDDDGHGGDDGHGPADDGQLKGQALAVHEAPGWYGYVVTGTIILFGLAMLLGSAAVLAKGPEPVEAHDDHGHGH